MNYRLLSKVLALVLCLIATAMCVCLIFEIWDGKVHPASPHAIQAFLSSIGVILVLAAGMWFFGRKASREMLRKEAIALVGLAWMLTILVGALPFILSSPQLHPAEAVFESASGFTTTGASCIAQVSLFPRSIILWRSMTQWLGGMGILVLFVAVLTQFGPGSKALFRHESTLNLAGGGYARIRDTAVMLWLIYLTITVACVGTLWLAGLSPYDSVVHAFATVSTGGFSSMDAGIMAYANPAVEWSLIVYMTLCGLSFLVYANAIQGRWRVLRTEEESRWYLALLALAALGIALVLVEPGADTWRASIFQVVSVMTTTGFASADFAQWPVFAQAILLLLMVVGGCSGSTAGGLKVSRLIIVLRSLRSEAGTAFRPNRVDAIRLNQQPVDPAMRTQAMLMGMVAVIFVSMSALLFFAMEPDQDLVTGLSAILACVFNVGPGLGNVGPMMNYSDLGAATQLMLALLMVVGRLEFFAVLVLFMPSLWRKY